MTEDKAPQSAGDQPSSQPSGPSNSPPLAGTKGSDPADSELFPSLPHAEADRSNWVIYGTVLFLAFVISYFMYRHFMDTRRRITRVIPRPKEFAPMEELVRATSVKELKEKDKFEITYDFASLIKDREQLTYVLKDWKGAIRPRGPSRKKGKFKPIVVPLDSPPLTPIFSEISFQYDLDLELELEPVRKCVLFIFFNFFYDKETTGTALRINPDGKTQFERYRRELRCNYPRGTPGELKLEAGKKTSIVIQVKDKPFHAGYTCMAMADNTFLTSAEFLPQWVKDRRYFSGESGRFIQADSPVPPQSGFVAIVSVPNYAVKVHRVIMRGTVAEYWREQRTRVKKIIKAFEEDQKRAAEEAEIQADVPTESPDDSPAKDSIQTKDSPDPNRKKAGGEKPATGAAPNNPSDGR